MKKYLLLFLMCVYASIGAWAVAVTVSTDSNGLTTVTCTDNGSSDVTVTGSFPAEGSISNIKVVGPFTTGVSDKIATALGNNFSSFTRLDLSEATGVTTSTLSNYSIVTWSKMGYIKHLILPKGASVPSEEQLQSNKTGSLDLWDAMEYFVIPQNDGTCDIYLTEPGLTSISDADIVITDKSTSTVAVHLAEGEKEDPATEATKTTIENNLKTKGYKLFVAPYTVSGCNVSINMDGAEADQTLADLITLAKAKVTGSICTLTVTGELTANDLIALGDTNMNGATRIDLSGATLASGVSIDDLQIPSSLTSLVLPKNTTVTVGLKTKMTSWTNLSYAYSPSTGVTETVGEEEHPVVADYVWVNNAGGLETALTTEQSLRESKYIKVASNEALNASDVDFSSTTALKYLDLRYANFTSAVSSSFKSSQAQGYRIILPDDWTEEEMTTFANVLGSANVAWAMAGIYSYSGTTLRIHELTDGKYMDTALSNTRIVYPGTTAIKVVTTLDTNLLAALNAAASSVKTITVTASSLDALTFNNPNITTLNVEGLNKSSATVTAGTGCTSLTTLNVTGSTVASVVATGVSSLTTVNLNGTTISGETNLSNTGLTTFTTNSSTKLQGDINLMSTALTSLNTTAEIGTTTAGTGNILLNGCESLGSITLGSAQFKNSTSMIHIDKSTTENSENTDAIDLLSRTETVGESQVAVKTIFVPNGFTSSSRIHPYGEVQYNVSEVAGSGANEDGDGCTITYDATTKVATVHTIAAGHFANMMETRYANYPQGATFKFDATSVINEDDLKALAGTINANDYSWRTNYYYVDLYDLTATDALCNYQTGTITNVINWLRDNNRQFKGLILPKDHTLYGSGISLIQSENPKHEGELSTCSEFIAYFKTKDMVNNVETSLPKKILFTHVYNQTATNSAAIQASNDKLTELLTAHGLNGAAENCPVDLYSVSTNGVVPFDATTLVGGKGYVETFNNEMVGPDTRANIYAYPSAAGEFTTFVNYSSINVTTTEVLKIDGTVSSDASAVAASINRFTNGPRVLDLKGIEPNSDEFLSALLPALTNSNIEYIILPEGKSKELVCNTTYSSSMTKLKAVISSTSTNLVAYVKQAGSLAEARYLATGGSTDGNIFSPSQTGLQSVTLAGNLNASDIAANTTNHYLDESGHWTTTSGNQKSVALWGEQGTITTIDLKDAVFATQTDMNFSYAGLGSIQNITLPTSEDMTLIPAECFYGITSFTDLCIPYNYTHIDNAALNGTYCGHITTTDAAGAVIDNGARTYTFSKNLKEIGSDPGADTNGVHSLTETVFPQNRGVTDVYVLAHEVPKCYANAFPANMLYGWGGFKGSGFPYCREKYDNSADGSLIFTVLHFPDEASYKASTDPDKESSYEEMKKLYTDVNKIYTKKEQTGAVDANGDEITWPTFSELRRTYNQATNGMTWNDWVTTYDSNQEVNGGDQIPTTSQPAGSGTGDYSFAKYEGWHQFTLALATYVEPDEKVEEEKIIREYVDAGWFTICIPFDMTIKQAREWLGVPQSAGNVICKYDNEEIDSPSKTKMPDIRQLTSVTRHTSTGGSDKNKVIFRLTGDLFNGGTPHYLDFNLTAAKGSRFSPKDAGNESSSDTDEKVCLKGGIPYIIKAYKRKGEKISGYNIGQYIMTRYSDEFKEKASCVNHGSEYYEYLGNSSDVEQLATLKFAKPYEEHQIVAMNDAESASYLDYDDNGTTREYRYALVGQFWTQKLPKYCFYQSKGVWYRNSTDNNYQWSAYKCVILAVPTLTVPNITGHMHANGNFRSNPSAIGVEEEGKSFYPSIEEGSTDKLNGTLKIVFADGRDDDDFAASAKYIFAFDDGIVEYDETGNEATAIDKLDGVDVTPLPDNYKVYNINGQYVGDSLEGLGKGLYIVNGKKYIVR